MRILINNARFTDLSLNRVLIDEGRIAEINGSGTNADREIDAGEALLLPGMIDVHAHLRDMDLAYKEDWLSGSQAASAGGVTTIFDMPNTKPATFDQKSLDLKRTAATKSIVNYGYNFGVNKTNLTELKQAAPIAALKMFLAESSSGRVIDDKAYIRDVFSLSKELGKPVIVHSELQSCVEAYEKRYEPIILNHNAIRNRECAIKSTELLLKIAMEVGNALYLAHISTAEEIALIRAAKNNGYTNIFCEVTPHHLLINESILNTVGNWGKVNPPLRTAGDNEALFAAVLDGVVDTIGSDHAPHAPEEKAKDYAQAPSGFPGFETTLPLLINQYRQGNLSLKKIVALTSENPAAIFNIKDRGALIPGYYADLVLIDPQALITIKPEHFYTKAKYSPFTGMELKGRVEMTIVNGHIVYEDRSCKNIQGKEIEFR